MPGRSQTSRRRSSSRDVSVDKRKKKSKPTSEEPTKNLSPSSVDLVVHRLRNLEYHPKPILCIAATPPDSTYDTLLAISRANGSVELRNTRQKLRIVGTVPGIAKKPVNTMAWIREGKQSPILVGASRDGSIFFVNFVKRLLVAITPSGGGGIFGLSALCSKRCAKRDCVPVVAAGCEDGSVRFFRCESGSSSDLSVASIIPSAGAAVLSVAWTRFTRGAEKMKSEKDSGFFSGTTLFAAVADGTIRRYDYINGSWKSTLRMTVECQGRATPTRVWSLHVLKDGTVISGDSLGHVQFWDGHFGTLQASFDQNDSKADVLALDASRDECKIFASGVDSRVISIQRSSAGSSDWVLTSAQRPHTHDVHAVVVYSMGHIDGLCTGGVDTKLSTYSVDEFQKRRPHATYPWPSRSPVGLARDARVLTMTRENAVDIYDIAERPEAVLNAPRPVNEKNKQIGRVKVESPYNLSGSCISPDGQYLVLGTCANVLLFQLSLSVTDDGRRSVSPEPVPLDIPRNDSIVASNFVDNNAIVLVMSSGTLHLVYVEEEGENGLSSLSARIVQTFEGAMEVSANQYLFTVDSIVASTNGEWFATSTDAFQGAGILVFRKNDDGSYTKWWKVPTRNDPHTTMGFLENQLVVASSKYSFYVFDLLKKSLSSWSEQAGVPVSKSLPADLSNRSDCPESIGINPAKPSQFFLGSSAAIVAVDTSRPFPSYCRHFPESHVRGRKRKRALSVASVVSEHNDARTELSSCTMCLRYNSMLFMDFVAADELVVVEQPWLSVVATFPEALQRKMYGT